jgi:hypothetical protein
MFHNLDSTLHRDQLLAWHPALQGKGPTYKAAKANSEHTGPESKVPMTFCYINCQRLLPRYVQLHRLSMPTWWKVYKNSILSFVPRFYLRGLLMACPLVILRGGRWQVQHKCHVIIRW